MKKISKILFFCLIASIMVIGINIQTQASVKRDIKTEISNRLPKGEIVKKIYYYDYDKNGRKEAFVLTGVKTDNKYEDGDNDLWFAYKKSGVVYVSLVKENVLNQCKVLKLKSAILFCAAEYCTTSTPMDVYKVVKNRAEYIFQGDTINFTKGNSFTSVHSTYDAGVDYIDGEKLMIGHTWKTYWFYYKKGKIYQHKAKNISQKKFKKKYKNAKKILKKYENLGKVQSILYRSNGLIHINYCSGGTSYSNITLKVKGKKLVKPVRDVGIYLKKMPSFQY